jgi:hypothetical protein
MRYFLHKRAVRAGCWCLLSVLTLLCAGRAIETWRLFGAFALPIVLAWIFPPAFLTWVVYGWNRSRPDPIASDAPPWAAKKDDFTKFTIILGAIIILEYVFKS